MNEGMNLVREIGRITGWANEMTDRRSRGEAIPQAELGEYQRAKVEVLAEIARRDPSTKAEEVLAAAWVQLAELEAEPEAEPGDREIER